jgi:hypothetical protein
MFSPDRMKFTFPVGNPPAVVPVTVIVTASAVVDVVELTEVVAVVVVGISELVVIVTLAVAVVAA